MKTTAMNTTARTVEGYRSLLELPLALFCLWAAYFHTPAGALVRTVGARVLGGHSSARPLLSYYSGAVEPAAPTQALVPLRPVRTVTGSLALAYGLRAHLKSHLSEEREVLRQVGEAEPSLADESLARVASAIERRRHDFGSEDAAVLSLFAGSDSLRFAIDRAHASNDPLTLESLARSLPPGEEDAVASAADVLALGTAYGLAWPLGHATLTSGFGMREHPVLGEPRMHSGIDLAVPRGTPVLSAGEGLVRRASEDAVNGRVLVIDHGHGVTTYYLHNEQLLVGASAEVDRGQRVALSGDTGRVTGPHLHYQLEIFGRAVDPLAFRPAEAQARGDVP